MCWYTFACDKHMHVMCMGIIQSCICDCEKVLEGARERLRERVREGEKESE